MSNDLQPALFSPEDDSALLFSVEEVRKRYTAAQAEKLEWKRTAILMLLASDWPVETICRELNVSFRTVKALAAVHAQKVAGFNKEFAQILLQTGARFIGIARTKEQDASFKDLMIGAGIVMQHARETFMMGEVGEEKVVKGDEDRAAAAAELRRMMAAIAQPGGSVQEAVMVRTSDSQSVAETLEGRRLTVVDAGGDAVDVSARRLDGAGDGERFGAAAGSAETKGEGSDQARGAGGVEGSEQSRFSDGSAKPGFVDKGPTSEASV